MSAKINNLGYEYKISLKIDLEINKEGLNL